MTAFENIHGLIIDMDGVLWHGKTPMPGLETFFTTLRATRLPFILATNNASLTRQQYLDKLESMGVNVTADEILTSSMATARYLRENLPTAKRRAFVIGEDGLREPLMQQGFQLSTLYQLDQSAEAQNNVDADIVVSGLDRTLTWDKLATATILLNKGAGFIATNADTTLPTEHGEVIGNGGVLAALTAATGRTPTVIGKPQPILYQQALEILGTNADNTVAIGDRLDTDILGAVNAGMRSLMVLTGVSSKQDIAAVDYAPTWVMDDIDAVSLQLKQLFNLE